jgi:hypothetical protein
MVVTPMAGSASKSVGGGSAAATPASFHGASTPGSVGSYAAAGECARVRLHMKRRAQSERMSPVFALRRAVPVTVASRVHAVHHPLTYA